MKVTNTGSGTSYKFQRLESVKDLREEVAKVEKEKPENIILFNDDNVILPVHDSLHLSNYDHNKSWVYQTKHYIKIKNNYDKTTVTELYDLNQKVSVKKLLERVPYYYYMKLTYNGQEYFYNDPTNEFITIVSSGSMIIDINDHLCSLIKLQIKILDDEYEGKTIVEKNNTLGEVLTQARRNPMISESQTDPRNDPENYKYHMNGYKQVSHNEKVGLCKEIAMEFTVPDNKYLLISKNGCLFRLVDQDSVCQQRHLEVNKINLLGHKYSEFVTNDQQKIINVDINLHTHKQGGMQLYLKFLNGKTVVVTVLPTDDILFVKLLLQDKEGISPNEVKLISASKALNENLTLAEQNVKNDTTIHAVQCLRGGGNYIMDITKKDKRVQQDFAKTAPLWRIAKHGLGFMGICETSSCPAYSEHVLYNHGLQEFCLEDIKSACCPKCENAIVPKRMLFNNCTWRFEGIKSDAKEQLIKTEWENIGNHIIYYDQDLTGSILWETLKIEVVRTIYGAELHEKNNASLSHLVKDEIVLPNKIFCSICLASNKRNKTMHKLGCNHIFHENCIASWINKSKTCPMCRYEILN